MNLILKPRTQQVYDAIVKEKSISRTNLEKLLGVCPRGLQKHITWLKALNLINFVDNRYYEPKNKKSLEISDEMF